MASLETPMPRLLFSPASLGGCGPTPDSEPCSSLMIPSHKALTRTHLKSHDLLDFLARWDEYTHILFSIVFTNKDYNGNTLERFKAELFNLPVSEKPSFETIHLDTSIFYSLIRCNRNRTVKLMGLGL
ncbi:unnamed protein product [Camellia sinensis]